MKKACLGIILGIAAGIVDIIPMILQNLSWDANLSAFSLWIISGFLISVSEIRIKGAMKGIIIAFMVLIPSSILIGWKEPLSLIPISVMTLILGFVLGYLIDRFGE